MTPFLTRLASVTGADGLITGEAMSAWHTDVYRAGPAPLAVVRPASVASLQAVVCEAVEAGVAIHPRGGGASYSDGYLPTGPGSIILDTGRLNRIVEINKTDAYVTVEAGVTWAALKDALDPLGLRTPFFGPFSGLVATIGGSVSQNAVSHGTGAHGGSAESVLSLDVVTASGELLSTGSAARGSPPFARHYGPDLTGLFTGDCGALGIKARITLPLLKKKAAHITASFSFATFADLSEAMRAAAMERLEDEHFAIDASLAQGQIARQDAGSMFGMARAVIASSPDLITGLTQVAKMGLAGSRSIAKARYLLHYIVEGVDDRETKAKLARLRTLMATGTEIPNSMPTVVRAMPFAPLFNILGPGGERWAALHGILPHSRVAPFHKALKDLYLREAAEMTQRGVWTGGMFATVGSGFLYEVALYWPGAHTDYHRATLPAEHLAGLPAFPDDPEATAYVARLKAAVIALMDGFGATHFQLGKAYPYAEALGAPALSLLKALKAELDPQNLMNPGALGLALEASGAAPRRLKRV